MIMKLTEELKIYFPTYECVLPVSKKSCLFNPFRVKDAKNLGIVLQENNKKLAFLAMVELLRNNTKDLDIESLCLADAEYLFLQIRSKSIDEVINVVYENQKHSLNISNISCQNENIKNKVFDIGNEISIELETPTIKNLITLNTFEQSDLRKASIKKVIIKKEIYDSKVFLPEEIKEFIENMPLNVVPMFDDFLLNQPRLSYSFKLNDGTEKEVNGLLDFFILR